MPTRCIEPLSGPWSSLHLLLLHLFAFLGVRVPGASAPTQWLKSSPPKLGGCPSLEGWGEAADIRDPGATEGSTLMCSRLRGLLPTLPARLPSHACCLRGSLPPSPLEAKDGRWHRISSARCRRRMHGSLFKTIQRFQSLTADSTSSTSPSE